MENKLFEYDSVVKLLRNYRAIDKHIKLLKRTKAEIDEYKTRGIANIHTDGIRVSSTKFDKIGSQLIRIEDMENKITSEIKLEEELMLHISYGLDILSESERDIIEMYYFDNMGVGIIGDYLGYDRSQIWRKKKKAIEKMEVAIFGIRKDLSSYTKKNKKCNKASNFNNKKIN